MRVIRAIAIVGLGLLLGCARNAPNTPAVEAPGAVPPAALPDTLAVAPHDGSVVFGATELRVDSSGAVAVEPVRLNQAIGDAYLVGLNDLSGLCNCFSVESVSRDPIPGGWRLHLNLAFEHPFDLTTRPDLFGWDLKAIVATDTNPVTLGSRTMSSGFVTNAAGLTGEWTPEILGALPTLAANTFPYIILGEDRLATTPFDFQNPSGWNVFPSGATNRGTLDVDVPNDTTVRLPLFFTVGYQVSATRTTRQTPDYTPPRGNARAPWRIESDVDDALLTVVTGSTATIDLRIWDWQHGQSQGSDVTGGFAYVPALMSGPVPFTLGVGTGRELDPLRAVATITNELGTFFGGPTFALIEIIDQLDQSNPGGQSGAPGVLKIGDDFGTISDLQEFRTYQLVSLNVASGNNTRPAALLDTTPPAGSNGLQVTVGTTVLCDASASFDPDAPVSPQGDLVLYEYDFDWDGILADFVADESGATLTTTSHLYDAPLDSFIGLRITDGVGAVDYATLAIEVVPPGAWRLELDPIQDIVSTPDDRNEWGAAFTEDPDGEVSLSYVDEWEWDPFQRSSPGFRSRWSGTTFETGIDQVGGVPQTGEDPNGPFVDWGWYLKAFPNWGSDDTLYLQFATDENHEVWPYLSWYTLGYRHGSPPTLCAGQPGNMAYSCDFAVSRTTGRIFWLSDWKSENPDDRQILAHSGGPNDWCVPDAFWTGEPTAVVDSRPCEMSHWRSTGSLPDGSIHVAYRAKDGSFFTVARDPVGQMNWSTYDLAVAQPGTFKDPTLDADPGVGVIAATVAHIGSEYQLIYFVSQDSGATWGPLQNAGVAFQNEPTDLAVSARVINGTTIIAIGHIVNGALWVRWTATNGITWIDARLSDGTADFSGDILMDRESTDLFGAWSVNNALGQSQLKARHGVFTED
ncbi:MAG: hypothetical protein ABI743_08925 [bacterium]